MHDFSELTTELRKLPGIGQKSARRILFYLLSRDEEQLSRLGAMISGLKDGLCTCSLCGNISPSDPCSICSDPLRNTKLMCLVEDIETLTILEESGVYPGIYHVLNSRGTPLDGDDFSDEDIASLLSHIKSAGTEEVIIAATPRIENEIMYYTLTGILKSNGVETVSRLAYGLPVGGSLEFADRYTLDTAFQARREL